MEKEFIFAIFVTLLFGIIKFIEIRYIDKEMPPLKYVSRDAIKVFFASWVSILLFSKLNGPISDFMNTITNTPSLDVASPVIFTGEPGF
jgi:H+/Cl- antiporter ClcA